jgi:DNA invertase Pin-like site-specific DNA recombinase
MAITENTCFPCSPARTRIDCQNPALASTKIPVGLAECAETSIERFSDTAAHGLCVPEGQLVSSGQYDGLRTYAAHAGLEIVQDYFDVGVSGRREGRPRLNALMSAARNRVIDCVLVWKFDRSARSTATCWQLEEFNHLGVRFISVQDQIDTDSPMGRAMFTIIGAMAELESSLVSERVTAGMKAAAARRKHLGRPAVPRHVVTEIRELAGSTDLSIRNIHEKMAGKVSRGIVGEITKRVRSPRTPPL